MTDGYDQGHREWLANHLTRAASRFEVVPVASPVFGWNGRSIGAQVLGANRMWLRVVAEDAAWTDDPFWTGNTDANVIRGVPKPLVRDWFDWNDLGWRLRAELMTLVSGTPCSTSPELRAPPPLPSSWWDALWDSLGRLASTDTSRACVTQADVTRRLRVFWGSRVDPTITTWTTAHGDLHWSNLLRPELSIVDWEGWGTAPAGYDEATLHCYSLLVPSVAARVADRFANLLETRDGRLATLYVIARLLLRVERGEHPDLTIPLHDRAHQILGTDHGRD